MDQVLDENLVSDLEGPGPPPPQFSSSEEFLLSKEKTEYGCMYVCLQQHSGLYCILWSGFQEDFLDPDEAALSAASSVPIPLYIMAWLYPLHSSHTPL